MDYSLVYDRQTGKVIGVSKHNDDGSGISFGLNPDNTDYQTFLIWNAEQDPPLDLDSTIEIAVNYSITPATAIILADGIDTAEFVIQADPADATINALIGDAVTTVILENGKGTLEVSASEPGIIMVTGEAGPLAQFSALVYAGMEL